MDPETKKAIEDLERRISKLESLLRQPENLSVKKESIGEFLLAKQPMDQIQCTLAVCYYLEKIEGFQTFNAKDIDSAFRKAKEPPPENINYNVIKNIKKGFLMEAKEKRENHKAWTLTRTGENHVEKGFGQSDK